MTCDRFLVHLSFVQCKRVSFFQFITRPKKNVRVMVTHSLMAAVTGGFTGPSYLWHSMQRVKPVPPLPLHYVSLIQNRARGYKTFFMLNSGEHKILNAHEYKNIKKFSFFQTQIS